MSEKQVYDVLIIGAGPAGYTAALYAGRANLKVLCFEGWQPGGQLTTTTVIENFPGFKDGIDGKELMVTMREQAARFGVEYMSGDVTKVDFIGKPFRVFQDEEEFKARSVIIATGARPKTLGLTSEMRLFAKGVSTCATCDGFFFRNKTVAVIGGGDSAMEEAGFLTRHANKVYIIHRREEFRASKIMQERTKANPKIELMLNQTVQEVLGEKKVEGLRLKESKTGRLTDLPLDGMFLGIGHDPSTKIFEGQIELHDNGYIKRCMFTGTNIPGIFAAGDCVDHRYRQAVTAAGDGCMAAMDAEKWLEEQK